MSDQQPMPQKRTQPPKRVQKPNASTESRFIGYLVLGFGVLAVIAVLIVAFSNNGPVQPVTEQKVVDDISGGLSTRLVPDPPQPEAPKKVVEFDRQPDIDPGVLLGAWKTMVGKYTLVMQIENGVYQIIIASDDPDAERLYSLGTYKTLEDMVLLNPRLDWPEPVAPKGQKVRYSALTMAPFPMVFSVYKDNLIWQNMPETETRVVAPYRSPLLLDERLDYIVWQKLK